LPLSNPGSLSLNREDWAGRFGSVVVDNLSRDYPYATQHLTEAESDLLLPVQMHPAFATSFDWHSCVHMHWLGASLLGFGIDGPLAARIEAILVENLTLEKLSVEADYLVKFSHYERPYGWAWALRLADEVIHSPVASIAALATNFAPLVDAIETLATTWVANVPQPVRHGVHSNSAFGLLLLLGSARSLGRRELATTLEDAARRWFGDDRGWPFDWERSGQDFLSAGMVEAELMRTVLDPAELEIWSIDFFSELRVNSSVLRPAIVTDESDPQQSHLFGLDLSRVAAAVRVAATLRAMTDASPRVAEIANLLTADVASLLPAALKASVSDEYYSTHWLATFAWDALEALETSPVG
jgi:hypothetical protein